MRWQTPHPLVACVIPVLNEAETVEEVVHSARPNVDLVVVVDGHSTDDTYQRAIKAGAKVISQEGRGKGAALRTALKAIDPDIFVLIDGDGTYDASDIPKFIQPILDDQADMVTGSRFIGKIEDGSIPRINIIGNKVFNFLINLFCKTKITDSQTGYRAISSKAVRAVNLASEGFEIETELTMKLARRKFRVTEVPIAYRRRKGSPSKLNSYKAGARIIKTIFKTAFNKSNSST